MWEIGSNLESNAEVITWLWHTRSRTCCWSSGITPTKLSQCSMNCMTTSMHISTNDNTLMILWWSVKGFETFNFSELVHILSSSFIVKRSLSPEWMKSSAISCSCSTHWGQYSLPLSETTFLAQLWFAHRRSWGLEDATQFVVVIVLRLEPVSSPSSIVASMEARIFRFEEVICIQAKRAKPSPVGRTLRTSSWLLAENHVKKRSIAVWRQRNV